MPADRETPALGAPLAAGAVVVAGLVAAFLPQHVGSISRLLFGALAVSALSLPLFRAVRAAADTRSSVFERIRWRRSTEDGVPGLTALRNSLHTTGPTTRVPLPPTVHRQLAAIVTVALDRHGIDPANPAHRRRLSATTWTVVDAERARRANSDHRPEFRVTPVASARMVHTVLDDLQRLDDGLAPAHAHHQGAT
jgi:hypothetical protein